MSCGEAASSLRADLTETERDEMAASRTGLCAICRKASPAHVDHCHETGRVRGVLCFNCNSAIGKLGDAPDTTRRATAYLEGNAWKPTLVAPGVCRLPS
ncbi:endonuclease VII domain-containing protein [Streptomyces beihaiensis]|uniref:Endonuclease VII domain-containing protein n=1 Tax=Streptomyces beihaiensis TaxID=2984495 RepID=A0ABT3U3N6_9ACTN|nr:endonuclease VII domain-containing protein [Streptomyces beihaiensis]MCX3063934.1 endonuclease VII domain-containing protein [Streptomyces beihaiensis]